MRGGNASQAGVTARLATMDLEEYDQLVTHFYSPSELSDIPWVPWRTLDVDEAGWKVALAIPKHGPLARRWWRRTPLPPAPNAPPIHPTTVGRSLREYLASAASLSRRETSEAAASLAPGEPSEAATRTQAPRPGGLRVATRGAASALASAPRRWFCGLVGDAPLGNIVPRSPRASSPLARRLYGPDVETGGPELTRAASRFGVGRGRAESAGADGDAVGVGVGVALASAPSARTQAGGDEARGGGGSGGGEGDKPGAGEPRAAAPPVAGESAFGVPGHVPPRLGPPRSILGLPVLHPACSLVSYWTACIMVMDLTYTAFGVPLAVAFGSIEDVQSARSIVFGALDLLGSTAYLADMLMGFCVGYVVRAGPTRARLVGDGVAVARFYARHGGFTSDLLATTPIVPEILVFTLPTITSSIVKAAYLLRLLRLLRVLRILRSIHGSPASFFATPFCRVFLARVSTVRLYLYSVLFSLAVLVNLAACLWVFIAELEGTENSWMATTTLGFDVANSDVLSQWLVALFWAATTLTTIGYGDVTPNTRSEVAFATGLAGVTILYFGFVVSTVSDLMAAAGAEAVAGARLRGELEAFEAWGRARRVSNRSMARARRYFLEDWAPHAGLDDEAALSTLPPALRGEIVHGLCGAALKRSRTLRALDSSGRRLLACAASPVRLVAGNDLYQEDDHAEDFFLLAEGEAVLLRGARVAAIVRGPCLLGAAVIFSDHAEECRTRTAGVRAATNCTLWRWHVSTIRRLLKHRPELLAEFCRAFVETMRGDLMRTGSHVASRDAKVLDKLSKIVRNADANSSARAAGGHADGRHEARDGDRPAGAAKHDGRPAGAAKHGGRPVGAAGHAAAAAGTAAATEGGVRPRRTSAPPPHGRHDEGAPGAPRPARRARHARHPRTPRSSPFEGGGEAGAAPLASVAGSGAGGDGEGVGEGRREGGGWEDESEGTGEAESVDEEAEPLGDGEEPGGGADWGTDANDDRSVQPSSSDAEGAKGRSHVALLEPVEEGEGAARDSPGSGGDARGALGGEATTPGAPEGGRPTAGGDPRPPAPAEPGDRAPTPHPSPPPPTPSSTPATPRGPAAVAASRRQRVSSPAPAGLLSRSRDALRNPGAPGSAVSSLAPPAVSAEQAASALAAHEGASPSREWVAPSGSPTRTLGPSLAAALASSTHARPPAPLALAYGDAEDLFHEDDQDGTNESSD